VIESIARNLNRGRFWVQKVLKLREKRTTAHGGRTADDSSSPASRLAIRQKTAKDCGVMEEGGKGPSRGGEVKKKSLEPQMTEGVDKNSFNQ